MSKTYKIAYRYRYIFYNNTLLQVYIPELKVKFFRIEIMTRKPRGSVELWAKNEAIKMIKMKTENGKWSDWEAVDVEVKIDEEMNNN